MMTVRPSCSIIANVPKGVCLVAAQLGEFQTVVVDWRLVQFCLFICLSSCCVYFRSVHVCVEFVTIIVSLVYFVSFLLIGFIIIVSCSLSRRRRHSKVIMR